MEPQVVSSFFPQTSIKKSETEICDDFLHLADELNNNLEELILPKKVFCVYNPTIYARATYEMYIKKFCNSRKRIVYLGMNPGPWGMSQTGVPFGEVTTVKNWLQIEGPVGKPVKEVAARPITGFECHRIEVSGKRFWGLFKELCGTADKFFQSSFVYNYLPQQWMQENGKNITPTEFTVKQMEQLYSICDPIFSKIIRLYEVETIIAIGRFCETRAKKVLQKYSHSSTIKVLYIPHPSPRSVQKHWDQVASDFLKKYNLLQYYESSTAP